MKNLGSEVARQPEGEVARQAKSSQSTQLNPKPNHDRTERPLVCPQGRAHCSHEIETRSFREEAENHDRTVKPVVGRDTSHEPGNVQSVLNEVNINFRIPALPHSFVKQAQNSRVRELVKKIENHPHRHAPQRDLQQNEAYNPFSATTKQMIQDVANVELFELFETDPKTQCSECLSYWSEGIVYCTCGHLLRETVANRSFIEDTLNFLSISEYVIMKGRLYGHRYGRKLKKRQNIIWSII